MRLVLSGFVCLLGITVADVQAGSNSVWVAALQDLNNIGGSISAANSLSATAGRDLTIQTTTQSTNTQVGSANFSRTGVDRVAGLYVSGANGTLVASAGRDLNIVAGVVSNAGSGATSLSAGTGLGTTAVTKESLAAAADEMRTLMVKDSSTFAGVVDSTGKKLSNASGASEGMNGDGVKLGGTRVDLDLLCGPSNERCSFEKKPDGSIDTSKPVTFVGGKNPDGTRQTLDEFLATLDGKKMEGSTGGVQGYKGTLFGSPYEAGSWQDKLIESFAGTHDMIGGKLSGLYDSQGNIKQGMSEAEINAYKVVSGVAIIPSAPFAAAQGLPPEVWNAILILLKAAK